MFQIKARLSADHDSNANELAKINKQLSDMGFEEITSAEVAAKLGSSHPMYDAISTSEISWDSVRVNTVYNGQQFEVQIITGTPKGMDSPLLDDDDGIVRTYSGTQVGLVNALQVLAEDVATSSISKIPSVGPVFSTSTTLYEMLKAFSSGISPTSIINTNDKKFSFEIYMTTTMRIAFVKYMGALDDGNQILAYAGSSVDCRVYVDIPQFTLSENGPSYGRKTIEYFDTVISYAYDFYECRDFAASNYWNYKQGSPTLDIYHHIQIIPVTMLDTVHNARAPYAFA